MWLLIYVNITIYIDNEIVSNEKKGYNKRASIFFIDQHNFYLSIVKIVFFN